MSTVLQSYGLLSLAEQARIPSDASHLTTEQYQSGTCGINIDGSCIAGGTKVAGSRGYRLAEMGYPMEAAAKEQKGGDGCGGGFCAAFPLWYSGSRQYELWGTQLATSRNPLLSLSPYKSS